ncbi:MAG: sigma-70 family RNA polymerase sigma factor [Oscillospiraceae bacterium]|nr:sigma-70 family RNA polymerase sigma factor [Oscillospiraceae bacterium]
MNEKILESVRVLQSDAGKSEKEKAFEGIYNDFSKSAYFIALKLMKNPQSAEDVTQEVFVKVFQKIGELKDPMAFPAWFKRVTVNQCTAALKKNKTLTSMEETETTDLEFFEESNENLIPDKALDNAESARLIVGIIDRLPAPQKVCIFYYYYEQLSVLEIAESLAVSENTVKTRLSLARVKIKKELEKMNKKEGIKLYSIAPFVIPALLRTMGETQVPEHLFGNISAELGLSLAATTAGSILATLKAKALIAAGTVVATGGVIAGVIIANPEDTDVEDAYNPDIVTTTATISMTVTIPEETTFDTITTFVESETSDVSDSSESIVSESSESSESGEVSVSESASVMTPPETSESVTATSGTVTEVTTAVTTAAVSESSTVTTVSESASTTATQTEPPKSTLKVGDMVKVGGFDWRVLEVEDGKALILSDKVLSKRQYHSDRKAVITWENCDLRKWLNGSFFNDTFSADEKSRIADTTVINKDNEWHGVAGGNSTTDKLFILSMSEMVKYFGDSGQLANRPKSANYINDQYNSARVVYDLSGKAAWLWVRSPGNGTNRAATTNLDGDLDPRGNIADNNNGGIRPAMWLEY